MSQRNRRLNSGHSQSRGGSRRTSLRARLGVVTPPPPTPVPLPQPVDGLGSGMSMWNIPSLDNGAFLPVAMYEKQEKGLPFLARLRPLARKEDPSDQLHRSFEQGSYF